MKNTLIIIFILGISFSFAFENPYSFAFSGASFLEADGISSPFFNPAVINYSSSNKAGIVIPSWYFVIKNNSFSISDYNNYNGKYWNDKIKNDILDNIDNSLQFELSAGIEIFGFRTKYTAFNMTTFTNFKGKLSKKYLDLALFGNEYETEYNFTDKNNDIESVSYVDLSLVYSQYTLGDYVESLRQTDLFSKIIKKNIFDDIPAINIGFGISGLIGLAHADLYEFDGKMIADDSGFSFSQTAKGKYSIGGYGLKLQVGLASKINDKIQVGLNFDNLGGFIDWNGDNKIVTYSVETDSVYISNLEDDIFEQTDDDIDGPSYVTDFPLVLRFSTKYTLYDNLAFALDYTQGTQNSIVSTTDPIIILSTLWEPIDFLPIKFGIDPGFGDRETAFSYGLGLKFKYYEFDLGIRSYEAIFPGNWAKGFGISFSSKVKF